jgi:putative transposase
LDKAFKAFFRRAKAGAGASSGYPRFKSSRDYPGFSYRKHRSGWRLDFKDGWRNGRARLGDVPGTVRFMGRLPAEPEAIKTCDVLWRDGHWWLSVCVAIARPRTAGEHDMRIRFDLIDRFASVQIGADGPCGAGLDADFQSADGRIIPLPQGSSSHPGQTSSETGGERRDWNRHRIDEIQSARDRCKRGSIRWRRLNARKRKIEGAIARRRREAYHVWTSAMIAEAKALTVIRPASIKDDTKSGHGTDRDPGAATELKAAFNRRVLDQAPALAVQMLAYKAAEAGVEYHEADHEDLAVGNATVRNHKAVRKVRRAVKHLQPETRP